MTPVKSRAVNALFNTMNRRFPNRKKDSDGWIGDTAHSRSKSGHNPDDTVLPAGGSAEYTDTDTKQEVRAADIDKDLQDPSVTMQQVADALRKDPQFQSRARYIIFNRRIASRTTDWFWEDYDGDSPHTEHMHVSFGPEADEDTREFTVILKLGVEDVALTIEERAVLDEIANRMKYVDVRTESMHKGLDSIAPNAVKAPGEVNGLQAEVSAQTTVLVELSDVDRAAVVSDVITALVPAVEGAIAITVQQAVNAAMEQARGTITYSVE